MTSSNDQQPKKRVRTGTLASLEQEVTSWRLIAVVGVYGRGLSLSPARRLRWRPAMRVMPRARSGRSGGEPDGRGRGRRRWRPMPSADRRDAEGAGGLAARRRRRGRVRRRRGRPEAAVRGERPRGGARGRARDAAGAGDGGAAPRGRGDRRRPSTSRCRARPRSPAQAADGYVVYPRGARVGRDRRSTARSPAGTEDFVAFDAKPAAHADRLRRSRWARARRACGSSADTLEVLDAGGAPRLRVAPPLHRRRGRRAHGRRRWPSRAARSTPTRRRRGAGR